MLCSGQRTEIRRSSRDKMLGVSKKTSGIRGTRKESTADQKNSGALCTEGEFLRLLSHSNHRADRCRRIRHKNRSAELTKCIFSRDKSAESAGKLTYINKSSE